MPRLWNLGIILLRYGQNSKKKKTHGGEKTTKTPGFPQHLTTSAVILSTLTTHPSSFIFENLQLWPKYHNLNICFDQLRGKKPHTYDISICDNTLRLLDLFPGCVYSCLCDGLDAIFFLKQLSAIKKSLMTILGAAQIENK